MRPLALVVALGLAASISIARDAHADPAAEQLFRDGLALMKRGEVAEACDRFARSQRLEPRTGTLLNLGSCREQLGRTASAWEAFMEAKTMATLAGDQRRAAEANRRATALAPKLAYLTISVPAERLIDGLALQRNGAAIDQAVWNVAVPVDPGDYELVASAPGHTPWSGRRTIGAAERATIVVEPLAKLATVTPVEPPAVVPQTPADPRRDRATPVAEPARVEAPVTQRWALGVTMGESTSLDPSFGVRGIRQAALPQGALRGSISALYNNYNDDNTNGFTRADQVLLGAGVEYVWLTPKLGFSFGVGAGLDLMFRNSNRGTGVGPWWGVRASPVIVRLVGGQLEAGLHVQGIQTSERLAAFGLVALDWYIR